VTAPRCPAGWNTSNTLAGAAWSPVTTLNDTPPNSCFSAASSSSGVGDLVSPLIAVPAGSAQALVRTITIWKMASMAACLSSDRNGAFANILLPAAYS